MSDTPSVLRHAPRALLLDFGGVIFQTSKRPTGRDDFAASLVARADRAGYVIDAPTVRASLDAAVTALKHWKHASSRRTEPREMTHREVVGDFLAADLPAPIRALLIAEAGAVLEDMNAMLSDHEVRPGIPALLAEAQRRGIPVGIVSNAHSGRSHRRLLAEHGLETAFAVQVYSDEVGMRKPHPRMIELASAALGVSPADAWYVGDTQDRDVVAGRRAGVGAVVLTASQHTDQPPFAVSETADAVYPTPEGLAAVLQDADAPAAPAAAKPAPRGRAALLIDHGGVISTSTPDAAMLDEFATRLAALLHHEDEPVDRERAFALIAEGRTQHKLRKAAQRESPDGIREVDATTFWRDLVGGELSERARALLEAEAQHLMFRYGRAKSRRTLRPGIRDLLETARAQGMPVVVVSNTVSGRAVRAECAAHGLDHLIAAYVCSDENGFRKPDPRITAEAMLIADADPERTWFLGDKPENDASGARTADIAHRVIVRGGSTPDDDVDRAVADGVATHAIDSAADLIDLITSAEDANRVLTPQHTI
ncbi:HAD family hydrolase [Microbacterium tenebrionis]|uniref:HAD family hydrolase n=1 Tax=Microbacterium tenebrionis TaxID=2830665 RepID=UPI00158C2A13|nr:HAD-IIIA family hydrolase [Microbacterium ihumii]